MSSRWCLPRIVAHRCGGALAPENTLAGLRVAAALGCGGVEFDVQASADGRAVVIHDERLDRTTDRVGPVVGLTAAELAICDAGIRHHPAFAGEHVPRDRPGSACSSSASASRAETSARATCCRG